MMEEDRVARSVRPYLTMRQVELDAMHGVFGQFDRDGSGAIDVKEFQQLVFEVAELTLTDKEAKNAVRAIDFNGNGTIDFYEFIMWYDGSSPPAGATPLPCLSSDASSRRQRRVLLDGASD